MIRTEIHIKGKLDPKWTDWFEGMQIWRDSSGNTILCGDLPDQSAVYGVLSRLGSLGFTLLSSSCRDESNPGPHNV
jgi:hypothetical protein